MTTPTPTEAGARADLLPCPFCGGDPILDEHPPTPGDDDSFFVIRCASCSISKEHSYKSNVLKWWNTRATGSLVPAIAVADMRERCAELADVLADEYDATSFTSTVAEQVAALRSKEQAAREIADAIRQLDLSPVGGGKPDRESGVDEIVGRYSKFINERPGLLSLLYDIDMLPEQTVTRGGAVRLAGLCEVWKRGEAGELAGGEYVLVPREPTLEMLQEGLRALVTFIESYSDHTKVDSDAQKYMCIGATMRNSDEIKVVWTALLNAATGAGVER